MSKRWIKAGSTDQTLDIFVLDSSSTVGAGLTGLVYNTASLVCYYRKGATGTPTALTLATQTVGGAHSDGGFVAVDGTNMPGVYRLDLSDTIVASEGMVTIYLQGATNMAPVVAEIEVGTVYDVNTVQVSGDATAADNLELQYDTTGLTGDNFPATQAQVGGIAVASAAINEVAESYTLTTGTQSANTYTATQALDGTTHQHTDTAGAMELYYQFDIGADGTPTSVKIDGALTGGNDSLGVYAYNWAGTSWDQVGTLVGKASTTNETNTYDLLTAHVGTGANAGKVRVRFYAASGLTSATLYVDRLLVSYAVVRRTVGYALGAIWIDTVNGTAGTTAYVNGTADNPVDSIADALTLSAAVNNINRFQVSNGSTITLAASTTNKIFEGHEWDLELGGQDVSSSMFIDAGVTGTSTGTLAEFEDSDIGAVTLGPSQFYRCVFTSTFTVGATGDYLFMDCASHVPGTGAPVFDLGALGTTTMSFRRWSGGMTINNIASGDVVSIDAVSGGTITLNGADGNVQVRGMVNVVDNRTGSPTLGTTNNMDARFDALDTAVATVDTVVDAILVDTAEIGVAGAGLTEAGGTGDQFTGIASVGAVSGAVGSVTGAVGSVTGNVGGNVVGSVGSVSNSNGIVTNLLEWDPTAEAAVPGSVAEILVNTKTDTAAILVDTGTSGVVVSSINNGAITAASIATDAIDADALAADAVSEIAAGISIPSAATIADAVWDEAIAGHAGAGSTGEALSNATAPTAAAVADAVWDEAISGHLTAGTTGAKLNAVSGSAVSVYNNAPYTLTADYEYPQGVVDVMVGTVLTLDLTLRDKDGQPLDLSGTPTVTIRCTNATSGATVGSDATATIEFVRGGIVSATTEATWSATAGTYRLTASVDYGTDVVIAGPLALLVRSR